MAISAIVAVEPIASALVARIKSRMANIKTGDGTKGSDMGPLVTKVHRDKVASYIEAGEKAGATLVEDGRNVKVDGDGFFLGPTLFDNVTPEMTIYKEEIFGPVLAIQTFRTIEEVIEKANNIPYGLSAGVWTDKGSKIFNLTSKLRAGVVWANTYNKFDPTSPFGGYKESGFGREGGIHGLMGYVTL